MIYSPKNNQMVSGKYIPRLALLKAEILGDYKLKIKFDGPENENYPSVIVEPILDHLFENIDLNKKPGNAFDCGDEAAEWITEWIWKTKEKENTTKAQNRRFGKKKHDYRIVYFDADFCCRDVENTEIKNKEKIGKSYNEELDYRTSL